MESILHVKNGDWQAIEKSPRATLVDFWAEWCGPCRMLAPTFEKLAAKYGNDVTFAKVDVDELPEVASQYAIRSVPTLLLLREGQVLEQWVGVRSYDDLARALERHVTSAVKTA